jgi:hypothetical protein
VLRGLLLEHGQERGGDNGNLVAAEGAEVKHVLALSHPAEDRLAPSLPARVEGPVCFSQVLPVDVGVDLSRDDA